MYALAGIGLACLSACGPGGHAPSEPEPTPLSEVEVDAFAERLIDAVAYGSRLDIGALIDAEAVYAETAGVTASEHGAPETLAAANRIDEMLAEMVLPLGATGSARRLGS